jgi:uncharacterized membrane protein YccC
VLEQGRTSPPVVPLSLTNGLLALLIAVIGVVAVYAIFFYRPHPDPVYVGEVVDAAGRRLQAHAPELQREAVSLGRETWPIVQSALIHEARHDYSRFARTLEREGSEYLTNVERAFIAKVKARYREYLQRHRQILESEFPEHATRENVERILAAFEATFDELVERYYLDQFRREAARTESLWSSIPPARPPGEDEPALEEQLAETTREWMVNALSGAAPTSGGGQ